MAHAKPADLKDLESLLSQLRILEGLKEKSLGCFYRKGKGVLHFHIQNGRRFAHVYSGTKWIELDIAPKPALTKQKTLVKKIQSLLSAD